jgi:hypothetical protein
MRNAAMAILFGFCAACSNQAAMSPSPSTVAKPPGTAPDRSGRTTPPTRLHRLRRLVGIRPPRQRRESWSLTNSTRQFRYR